jgi:uncharacterized protein YktA (UPF0223 family)
MGNNNFDVYAYYIANDLPSESLVDHFKAVNFKPIIKNQGELSIIEDLNYPRKFKLKISAKNKFKIPQVNPYYFISDLLLAINLNLKEVFISPFQPLYLNSKNIGHPIEKLSLNQSQDQLKKSKPATVSGKIFAETIRAGLAAESIDENIVLDYLNFIETANVHTSGFKTDSKQNSDDYLWINIKLSLLEYEAALSSFIPVMRFKHLFNALEFAVNYDGIDRIKEKNFPEEVAKITNNAYDKENVEKFKNFYNRTKHIVTSKESQKMIKDFDYGYSLLFTSLSVLREICNKIMHDRINILEYKC